MIFPQYRLAEVGVAVLDCDHRTPKPSTFGYPYIAIPNIKHGRLDLSDVRLISEADYISWTRRTKPQAGDIILTRRARVGDTAVVPPDLKCAIGQNLVIIRSNGEIVDQSFLRWLLSSPLYWNQVDKYRNEGAVFSSLNVSDIPKFQLPIPSLPIQHRIADILGTLDDKIEVNHRINRRLEALALALFKNWFIDFGPFQEGQFVESELRFLPEGWDATNIGAVCSVVSGGTPRTDVAQYWDDGDIYWATPSDMTALASPVIFDTSRKITREGMENSSATLLPIGSVLVTSRATLGVSAITHVPITTNQGFKSIVCGPRVTNHFMLLYIKLNQDLIIARANGSTFLEINANNFKALPLVVPTPHVMQGFDQIVKPLFDQIYTNEQENKKLTEIRDYLLPRLLSGEIPVEAAEEVIADAG